MLGFIVSRVCERLTYQTEMNVFKGFFDNPIFSCVIGITVVVQAAIIFGGGAAFKVVPLNGPQWLVSVLLGVGSLVVGMKNSRRKSILIRTFSGAILRLIPVPPTKQPRSATADMLEEQLQDEDKKLTDETT